MRISDWSSDVCSSDLPGHRVLQHATFEEVAAVALLGARVFRAHAGFDVERVVDLPLHQRVAVQPPLLVAEAATVGGVAVIVQAAADHEAVVVILAVGDQSDLELRSVNADAFGTALPLPGDRFTHAPFALL